MSISSITVDGTTTEIETNDEVTQIFTETKLVFTEYTLTNVTTSSFQELIDNDELVAGKLYYNTETGRILISLTPSTYLTFVAVHLSDTPPDDTSLLWFDTNLN